MRSLLVAFGRLNVVLVLLGSFPALISARPVPMDEDDIGAMAYRLFHDGIGGLVSPYVQHSPAPASALHADQAANPNGYHPASRFADARSSSGPQGTDWTGLGHPQHSLPEWKSFLHPADHATTIHPSGTPAHVRIQLDHQDPYASGRLGYDGPSVRGQARRASSSRTVPQLGSVDETQLATPPEPARARAMDPMEASNPLGPRGATAVLETSVVPHARDLVASYLNDRVPSYRVGPSYGSIPTISKYDLKTADPHVQSGNQPLERYESTRIFQAAQHDEYGNDAVDATAEERTLVQEKFARDMALALQERPAPPHGENRDVLIKWYDAPADDFVRKANKMLQRTAKAMTNGEREAKARGPFTPYYVNEYLVSFTKVKEMVRYVPGYGRVNTFRVTVVPDPVRKGRKAKLPTRHLGYVLVNRVPLDFEGVGPMPPWDLP